MNNINMQPTGNSREFSETFAQQQQGLLRNVFVWMALGLLVTASIALSVASNQSILNAIARNSGSVFIIFIAQIGLVFYLSMRIMRMRAQTAAICFVIYSALNGITMSLILLMYTGASVAATFFITAATFGAMALYGSSTKRNLSKMGSYLFMALIGIIIASIVNIFLRSSGLYWIISFVGVLLFSGLTAYDTQVICRWSNEMGNASKEDFLRLSILGALKLYLDFINLFLFLLRFLGKGRQ